jgi:DnaK suppressor protein
MGTVVDETYRPTEDEPFMNDRQLDYFRRKLLAWKDEILDESRATIANLQLETVSLPDLADRATSESDRSLELRTRDRERKLIKKIEESLENLERGDYGFCETCGIEIGLRRLEARPTSQLQSRYMAREYSSSPKLSRCRPTKSRR